MAFKFRFERILSYRRHLEKTKMEELAVEQRKLRLLTDELSQLLAEQETKLNELREKEQNAIKIDELLQYRHYLTRLYRDETGLRKKIIKQEDAVEKKRLELVEASKERRVMERLRETKERQYWAEYWKQDEQANDDLTSSRRTAAAGADQ